MARQVSEKVLAEAIGTGLSAGPGKLSVVTAAVR
jgi:hypothetical protein